MKYFFIAILLVVFNGCASVEERQAAKESRCGDIQDPKAKETCMDQVQIKQAAPRHSWHGIGSRLGR